MSHDRNASARTLQTSAERDVFGAAAVYMAQRTPNSQPEEAFLDRLPAARRNICSRLIQGLLRGQPDGLPPHTILPVERTALPDDAHRALRRSGADELFQQLQPLPERCQFVAFLPFPTAETIVAAPIEAIYGYDRFQLAESVTLLSTTEPIQNPHPVAIISLLEQEGVTTPEQAERITEEIAESTANLAFARLAAPTNPGTTFEVSSDHSTVLDVLETLSGADPASALERLATEGHPFHPSAKIRRGMTPAESLLYAPEFTDEIDVRFIAVDTEHALQAHTGSTLTELLSDCFPRLEAAVEQAVPTDSAGYAVVPVHPWQYYHVVPDRYAAQIADGRVVPVPEYTVPATPLLNLRTVVPKTDDPQTHPQPHLKLAVDVQLTNVVRTVSPQAVSNGPQVTELLHTILERDSFDHLGILSEAAATCYHASGGPHPDGDEHHNARNLSGLARQNPYTHSLVPEEAVPIAVGGLLTSSPVTNRPIICDVLDRFAATHNKPATAATAKTFFEVYVDTVVPEQLHLLSKYGIALETHPQNSYVVFSNGEPVATVVRDLGGIRVLNDRLAYHGFTLDTYPNSDIDAAGERALYNKLYYALFQNHFTELIITLGEHTPLDEAACWDYVRTRCLETFETLRAESTVPEEWVNRDENALFEDPATHKALTAMRLQGKRHEYVTSHVSNPLVDPAE